MNLSIFLTLLRIAFVPLVVVLLLARGANWDLWAVAVFLVAAATDLLDGYFARQQAQITKLGIIIDPVADKLLTTAAFIVLVERDLVPAWMVVIIVGREFAISGLRAIASAQGLVVPASPLGKTKMVLQVAAIATVTLGPRYQVLSMPGQGLMWLVVLLALVSAAQYFRAFWRRLPVKVDRAPVPPLVVMPIERREQEKEKKSVSAHHG